MELSRDKGFEFNFLKILDENLTSKILSDFLMDWFYQTKNHKKINPYLYCQVNDNQCKLILKSVGESTSAFYSNIEYYYNDEIVVNLAYGKKLTLKIIK